MKSNLIRSLSMAAFAMASLAWPQVRGAEAGTAAVARVVLVGDSTVASGGGWGDAFGRLLADRAECLNLGRNGRSSKSYRDEGHWQKALEAKPDWVLIQFGHNDQPGKGPERETDAATSFRRNLERFVDEARAIGARPVLVTPLTRRNFNAAGRIESGGSEAHDDARAGLRRANDLSDYAAAVRAVASEKKVPLIDLNARSIDQMNRLGPRAAAVFHARGREPGKPDTTHLSPEGAEKTAALVASEIRGRISGLSDLLAP